MAKKLTDKQRRFIEEYCSNGFNATQAAISAGYSEKTAQVQGSETLSKPMVQDGIQEFMSKATEKALVTTEDLIEKLLYECNPQLEGSNQSARIQAIKVLTDYTGGFDNNTKKTDNRHTVTDSGGDEW